MELVESKINNFLAVRRDCDVTANRVSDDTSTNRLDMDVIEPAC